MCLDKRRRPLGARRTRARSGFGFRRVDWTACNLRHEMRTKESVHKAASAQPPDADEEEETTVRRRFIGQCKKGNCCLEDGHAGSCNDGNMSEEEYEVECITAEKATRGGKRKFLVKWKGWPSEDSTWETSAALAGAKEVRAPSSRVLNLACSAQSPARSLARDVARY